MSVKIRLARRGRRKAPFYHIVIADSRSPRDGRFIENIGKYNPLTSPATIELDRDRAFEWLMKGAQPTETARAILRFKGVMYRKHLARGVAKGALTEEKAQQMYNDFVEAKEAKITQRFEETKAKKAEYWKTISGEPKAKAADPGSADKELEQFQNVELTEGEAEAPDSTAETKAEEVVEAAADTIAEAKVEEVVEEAKSEATEDAKDKAAPVAAAAVAAVTTAVDKADAGEEAASAEKSEPVAKDAPAEEPAADPKKEEAEASAGEQEE